MIEDVKSNNTKKHLFLAMLDAGAVVMLDVRSHYKLCLPDHVLVPVILQYSRNFANPINFKDISDEGIVADLAFDHITHETFVPWAAVAAMWFEDRSFGAAWALKKESPPEEAPKFEGLKLVK